MCIERLLGFWEFSPAFVSTGLYILGSIKAVDGLTVMTATCVSAEWGTNRSRYSCHRLNDGQLQTLYTVLSLLEATTTKALSRALKFYDILCVIRGRLVCYCYMIVLTHQGPVSLRLMTSQFKDIVTYTQKLKTVKCIFCGVWVQNFVRNFKGALWNFTQNFEPIHRKICILRVIKNLTTYDILELWHLKS